MSSLAVAYECEGLWTVRGKGWLVNDLDAEDEPGIKYGRASKRKQKEVESVVRNKGETDSSGLLICKTNQLADPSAWPGPLIPI